MYTDISSLSHEGRIHFASNQNINAYFMYIYKKNKKFCLVAGRQTHNHTKMRTNLNKSKWEWWALAGPRLATGRRRIEALVGNRWLPSYLTLKTMFSSSSCSGAGASADHNGQSSEPFCVRQTIFRPKKSEMDCCGLKEWKNDSSEEPTTKKVREDRERKKQRTTPHQLNLEFGRANRINLNKRTHRLPIFHPLFWLCVCYAWRFCWFFFSYSCSAAAFRYRWFRLDFWRIFVFA